MGVRAPALFVAGLVALIGVGPIPEAAAAPTNPSTLVNSPVTDSTSQDTQSNTTIALSGSNIVAAWRDSGSSVGGAHQFTGYGTAPKSTALFTDRGVLPGSAEGDKGDPVLAVDSTTGRVYMATPGFVSGSIVQVFRSDDNGVTFGAPVNATPGYEGSGALQTKPWITVDNFSGPGQGNVYLAWHTVGSAPLGIYFNRSMDGGTTWTPPLGVLLAPGGQAPFPVVGKDHSVSVFYWENNAIKLRKSTDFGFSFGPEVLVQSLAGMGFNGDLGLNGGFSTDSFPRAAVNPVSGELYVVYNDVGMNVGDKADIFFTRSTNGGATWSPKVRVDL